MERIMEQEIRKPDAQLHQAMLDSFNGLRLPQVDRVKLRSSSPDLSMEVLCEEAAPLRDGLRPERPSLNRALLNKILTR
jgi:hypothetical protein